MSVAGSELSAGIGQQVAQACAVIERHLAPMNVRAIHLFGSALDGGLKPHSDIDLLVTVDARPGEAARQALMRDLLAISAPPGEDATRRALEVTVLAREEILPWRHPARRELQFGEWLRQDLLAGVFEPPMPDSDLAILLTKARRHSLALKGPAAQDLFDPVPRQDFVRALADTLAQWRETADWAGDERNVVLAIARIWFSAETGRIAPKDAAAAWLLERVPTEHQSVLREARSAYLGTASGCVAMDEGRIAAFVRFARPAILDLLDAAEAGA